MRATRSLNSPAQLTRHPGSHRDAVGEHVQPAGHLAQAGHRVVGEHLAAGPKHLDGQRVGQRREVAQPGALDLQRRDRREPPARSRGPGPRSSRRSGTPLAAPRSASASSLGSSLDAGGHDQLAGGRVRHAVGVGERSGRGRGRAPRRRPWPSRAGSTGRCADTPELCPDWCRATPASFSSTATARPGRACSSACAVLSPTRPAPTTTTSKGWLIVSLADWIGAGLPIRPAAGTVRRDRGRRGRVAAPPCRCRAATTLTPADRPARTPDRGRARHDDQEPHTAWQDAAARAAPPRRPSTPSASSTSTSPRRCAAASSSTPTRSSTPARCPTPGTGSSRCTAGSCTRWPTWACAPTARHVKCARVVGEVMGKLHPHGDWRDLRRAGADGPAVLDAGAAGRRARQLRLAGRRPGGHALHRVPAGLRRAGDDRLPRRGRRRLRAELRRHSSASRRCCPRRSPTCWSTARPASPSAWPPTWPRTTSARSSPRPGT